MRRDFNLLVLCQIQCVNNEMYQPLAFVDSPLFLNYPEWFGGTRGVRSKLGLSILLQCTDTQQHANSLSLCILNRETLTITRVLL